MTTFPPPSDTADEEGDPVLNVASVSTAANGPLVVDDVSNATSLPDGSANANLVSAVTNNVPNVSPISDPSDVSSSADSDEQDSSRSPPRGRPKRVIKPPARYLMFVQERCRSDPLPCAAVANVDWPALMG